MKTLFYTLFITAIVLFIALIFFMTYAVCTPPDQLYKEGFKDWYIALWIILFAIDVTMFSTCSFIDSKYDVGN